eukprot:gnl/MRDRNA2_/MRDRNA2_117819_c0_seq1.p1 gnl/MRDRNA2_/MRDRNA2_117819_c0~~gnl/MRDRNA2_/MRDRNA2_117819_c0_seq1.p1  ORF type:complete len:583 (-),score=114.74 gnl/MRDRNA2_/MRDRNA2_117819_c0_seq1:33-1574(-)
MSSSGNLQSQMYEQEQEHLKEIQEVKDRHKVEVDQLKELLDQVKARADGLEKARQESNDRLSSHSSELDKIQGRMYILKQANSELKTSNADLQRRVDLERRAKDRAIEDMILIKRQAEEKAKKAVQAMDCFLHPAQVAKTKAELRTAEHERQALTAENESLRTALEMFRQKILEVSARDRGPMVEVLENIISSTGRSVYQRLYEDAVRRMGHLSNLFDSLRLSPMGTEHRLPLAEQLRSTSTMSNYGHYWSTDDASPRNGESRRSVSCPPISLDMMHSMHTKNAESLSTMRDDPLVPTEGIPEIPELPHFVKWTNVKSLQTPEWLVRSAAKHLGQFRNEVLFQKVNPGVSPSPAPTGPSPVPCDARPSPAPGAAPSHWASQVPRNGRSPNPGGSARAKASETSRPERPSSVLSVNDSIQGDITWEDSFAGLSVWGSVESNTREPPMRRYSHGATGRNGNTQNPAVKINLKENQETPRSQTPNLGHRNRDGGRAFFSRRRQVVEDTPRPRSVME